MTAQTSPPLYHGTRTAFGRGGYLFPVDFHRSPQRPGHAGDDSTAFVYVTPDRDLAVWYALNTPRGRARPRVLLVEPLGPVELDPSTYEGEWGPAVSDPRTPGPSCSPAPTRWTRRTACPGRPPPRSSRLTAPLRFPAEPNYFVDAEDGSAA